MTPDVLVWGAANWLPVSASIAAVLLALLIWGYWRAGVARWVRFASGCLKLLAVLILLLCLLDPLISGSRVRPGANSFILLADNSQSMQLRDRDAPQTRADELKHLAAPPMKWLARLRDDFDVREYSLDTQLRATSGVEALSFDGRASNLITSLQQLSQRYQGRPLAGILLFSDGIATDAGALERLLERGRDRGLPPIYPVLLGGERGADDVGVGRVTIAQTNFEDAPVTLTAHAITSGYRGRMPAAQLLDDSGKVVATEKVKVEADDKPAIVRFQLRPEHPGVSFYRMRIAGEGEIAQLDAPEKSSEATLANNSRLIAVDRGRGPYRVLYVSGRPNWEFKFLSRAVQSDEQVQLVGLLRIARREPKFNFLSRAGESSNPLYRGFDPEQKQPVEQYDQPVLVRLGTSDESELRSGFPQTAEELYRYHAVILDDVESEFFTQDQMQLLKEFVRQRGGGLLMLGGQESFKSGKFDRTPIGDLLPVYADQVPPAPDGRRYRLSLTREGWLEPWVRLRGDEETETKRLGAMPAFHTLNQVRGIKPGATVLARVVTEGGTPVPALVEQRFGQGRVGAMLIGDLWRWGLRRPANEEKGDLEKSWRQTVRWLVADVPQRVDVAVEPRKSDDDAEGTMVLSAQVRDVTYAPLDNAKVTVKVTAPDGKAVAVAADPTEGQAGRYEARYVPRLPGAYRAEITAASPDGSEIARVETGWSSDPAVEEFSALTANRALLFKLASATGGQLVKPADLDRFVATLPTRAAQITEPYIRPLWHQPWIFLLAIACLCAEWGLRRWKGLP